MLAWPETSWRGERWWSVGGVRAADADADALKGYLVGVEFAPAWAMAAFAAA